MRCAATAPQVRIASRRRRVAGGERLRPLVKFHMSTIQFVGWDHLHAQVNLLTATVKLGERDGDAATQLRFCFRIVSPEKTFTLQARGLGFRVRV